MGDAATRLSLDVLGLAKLNYDFEVGAGSYLVCTVGHNVPGGGGLEWGGGSKGGAPVWGPKWDNGRHQMQVSSTLRYS